MIGRAGCHLQNTGILFHMFEDFVKEEMVEDEREGAVS